MLEYFFRLIREKYTVDEIGICMDRQHNSLIFTVFHSLVFKLYFSDQCYRLVLIAANGYESDKIGGRILSGDVTDDTITDSVEFIYQYTRNRLGDSLFEGL